MLEINNITVLLPLLNLYFTSTKHPPLLCLRAERLKQHARCIHLAGEKYTFDNPKRHQWEAERASMASRKHIKWEIKEARLEKGMTEKSS